MCLYDRKLVGIFYSCAVMLLVINLDKDDFIRSKMITTLHQIRPEHELNLFLWLQHIFYFSIKCYIFKGKQIKNVDI